MRYGLGFPAVAKKGSSAVLLFSLGIERKALHTQKETVLLAARAEPGGPEEIRPDSPFMDEVSQVQACLRTLFSTPGTTRHVTLTLAYHEPEVKLDDLLQENQLDLSPASAEAALSVLGAVENLVPGGEDYFIQISARVNGAAVEPLNDINDLVAKTKKCLSRERTVLLLHEDDVESLREDTGFQAWLKAENFQQDRIWGIPRDFDDADAFEQALEAGKKLFPLPVDAKGRWRHGKNPTDSWSVSLARVLQFPLREYGGNPQKPARGETPRDTQPDDCALDLFLRAARGNDVLSEELRQGVTASPDAPGGEEPSALLTPLPPENLGNLVYLDSLLAKTGAAPFWPAAGAMNECLPNIIISGPTGCGKTLLAQALLVNARARSLSALYVGPTRALVEEVYARLKALLPDSTIILSTGEATDDDWRFNSGDFDIACLVTEKANVLLAARPQLMERLGCVVIDEIHMLASADRGGTLDMLMAKIRDRQATEEGQNLRLAVASTELPTEGMEDLPLPAFLTRENPKNLDEVSPLVIASGVRPHPVRHQVKLYCRQEGALRAHDLGVFGTQHDRQRDDAWHNEQYNSLLREMAPEKWADEGSSRGFGGRAENALIEHILEIARTHSRTIVVDASKGKIRTHAENAYKKRKLGNTGEKLPDDDPNVLAAGNLKVLLEEGELPGGVPNPKGEVKSLGALMVEWAACGVYIHHADIPRKARNIVEAVFRAGTECRYPPVVFCTETLSYGVNLRADAVILCELQFPRSDTDWRATKTNTSFLTPTEYHNILGRVGRFSTDTTNDAFIFINVEEKREDVVPTLLSYYRADPTLECRTLNIEDIRKFNKGKITDLDDISFASFSTVMDGLRMAQMAAHGRPVTAAKVRDMLDLSYFMDGVRANGGSGLARAFEKKGGSVVSGGAFVDTVLELACQKIFSGDIHLISKAENENEVVEYSLEKGAALIDTGMHWSNVAPMARWIARLKALCPDAPLLPMEFFLPALLACPKVYNDYLRTSFGQFRKPTSLSPEMVGNWRDEMQGRVKGRLEEILKKLPGFTAKGAMNESIERFLGEVRSFANEEAEFKNAIGELYPSHKPLYMGVRDVLFLAMLAVSLDWLNGDRQEMYKHPQNPALPESTREIPAIPGRLFELMAWSAQMCANFFPEPILGRADKGQLSRLVPRLRKGVPLAYLPLAQASDISASQILKLRKHKITCEDILRRRGYPAQKKAAGLPDQKVVVKALHTFYIQEYSKLERRVAPRFSGQLQLKEFMKQFLREKREDWKESHVPEFAGICGSGSNSRLHFDKKGVLTIEDPQAAKAWRVALTNVGDPEEGCHAVCYLPWRPEDATPPDVPIFTPGSLFAACHFLERTRAPFEKLLQASGAARVISFAEVLNWSEIDLGQDALALMEPFDGQVNGG